MRSTRLIPFQQNFLAKNWKPLLIPVCAFFLLAALVLTLYGGELENPHFQEFTHMYQKSYASYSEHSYRRDVFLENLRRIQEHNEQHQDLKLAVNRFADRTMEELALEEIPLEAGLGEINPPQGIVSVPESLNWTATGKVTQVKDERDCTSSAIFATLASIESLQVIFEDGRTLLEYSEQAVIDCSEKVVVPCKEVDPSVVYTFSQVNGTFLEAIYPYEAEQYECRSQYEDFSIQKSQSVTPNKYADILDKVNINPLVVLLDADTFEFRFYQSGVFTSQTCSTNKFNRALLMVGYGTDKNGDKYFILKNSWGKSWGEKGYMRIGTDGQDGPGTCGVQAKATYPAPNV